MKLHEITWSLDEVEWSKMKKDEVRWSKMMLDEVKWSWNEVKWW